ncbi:MAG: glycosyltransferase family 4 protein [Aureliella sp.]
MASQSGGFSCMRTTIFATGFVEQGAGSVASANGVLLRGLLERQHKISFFTKPSFVDPRPLLSDCSSFGNLQMVDCSNRLWDGLRARMTSTGGGIWGRAWVGIDAATYNRKLVDAMRKSPGSGVDLWLGDWARGRGERKVVSFVQGPPGTDARSVFTRADLIKRLSGRATWMKLAAAARWRLGLGLPRFDTSDLIILGSRWSRSFLIENYGASEQNTMALPYPIDLDEFSPPQTHRKTSEPLRIFWLGRFAPRKRLDLFLNGLSLAIREGCDAEAWVVGASAFASGFEKLLDEFPYPSRLKHWMAVPREKVPALLADVDVMAQPSDEENFGSSVAEALACGVPSIVGATNGTGDYVCENSIRLRDDHPETFAEAVIEMAARKKEGRLQDRTISRAAAEYSFSSEAVVDQLENALNLVASGLG